MDYAALKNEILNDPAGLGYAGKTDGQIADLLNAPGWGFINRDVIPTYEIFDAIEPSEYGALTAEKKTLLHAILAMGTVDIRGSNLKKALSSMFPDGTVTRDNLLALQKRPASRAEVLGFGHVTHSDVAKALRG